MVGRILDAWGIRGAVKVQPYASDGAALRDVKQWWIERDGTWEPLEVLSAKTHGEAVTATLTGYTERGVAERLKGIEVWIARSRFPPLSDDEYYWVDLIGLNVVNVEGRGLGVVRSMLDNGAHAILEVGPAAADGVPAPSVKTILIPFVERYVRSVERDQSRIVVEWGPEYES